MRKYQFPTILFLVVFPFSVSVAQLKKAIALEEIWASRTFIPEALPGFNWYDERSYTALDEKGLVRYDLFSEGKEIETLFLNKNKLQIDDYFFNEDKSKIVFQTETEEIYRHSYKAIFYFYDSKSSSLKKLTDHKISYPSFSPDGNKLAYVYDNNLYFLNLTDLKETAVTNDGRINEIINGSTDWVYEEEFSITKVFSWSADSKKIAYLKFNEKEVKEYNLQFWKGLYPEDYKYKYPKAGEKNSTVTVHCYFLQNSFNEEIKIPRDSDTYIPRITWTKNADILSIQTLNRLQNHFQLYHINVLNKSINKVYEEKNSTYVDITDDLKYLKDGLHFLLTSEKDGYKHVYKYDMNGKLITQITKGNWEVDKIKGVDEKNGIIYFTSTEASPMERQLYSIEWNGEKKRQLTKKKGNHEIEMSPANTYFVDNFSSINMPPEYSLHYTKDGKEKQKFITNEQLIKTLENYQISPAEFFKFKTKENVELNGWMIKPYNMEQGKKYPVMLFVYGGPGIQTVNDSWMGPNYLWFQMLAQKGYVVVSIDGRGTGGRGADFKKITQNELGKYETKDVINTAVYLGEQSFIDKERIGIFGWSFGGYLSSLAITIGADYFKTAIAVAPVISWRFYDTIYTERYLGLPDQNAKGYDENSPLFHAGKLKGNYLLVHGTGDDNVHAQNSLMMQNALIKANKQFEVFYYPNRNHGIYGGTTRLHLYKMMTEFILNRL